MATIDDLDASLRELIEAVRAGNKDGSSPGGKGPKEESQRSLADAFGKMLNKQKDMPGKGGSQAANLAGKSMPGSPSAGAGVGAGAAFAGPLIALGVAMAKLPEQVREFTNQLHAANRAFANFSPAMAQVFAQSDMRDMMRKMQQGDELAGSAGGLADARGRLEDALTPVDTGFQKIQNTLGDIAGNAVSIFLERSEWAKSLANFLEEVNETLTWIAQKLGRKIDRENEDIWAEEMRELEREEQKKIADRMRPVRAPAPDKPLPGAGGGDF